MDRTSRSLEAQLHRSEMDALFWKYVAVNFGAALLIANIAAWTMILLSR